MSLSSFFNDYRKPGKKWQKPPALSATLDTEIVNAWLVSRMDMWGEEGIGDESLWIEYQQDFDGWKAEDFAKGETDLVRAFRDYLRS